MRTLGAQLSPFLVKVLGSVHGLAVPILFFLFTLWVMPIADVLQFDPDEGIELAKVTLYNAGYTLYDQIWNDQPPLLTLFLAHWLKVWGSHIVAARLLSLSFATLLVGAFYNTLVLILSIRAALLGTVGLCLTLNFLRLSVSVMRGLPALALAMVAIYFLMWESYGRSPKTNLNSDANPSGRVGQILAIAFSGICFGLSLQLKFYTLLLLPACVLHLILGSNRKIWTKNWHIKHLFIIFLWLLACGITFLGVGWLTHMFSVQQMVGTHFDPSSQDALQNEPSWLLLLTFLAQDLDYSLLAGVGIYRLLKQNPQWPILPLVWLLTVLIALANYQPLWYHYYPLIVVPIVWLAIYGATESLSLFRNKQWYRQFRISYIRFPSLQGLTTGFLIFAIALAPLKLTLNAYLNHQFVQDSKAKLEMIEQVRALQSSTRWLFTDLPIVAFYTNLKVPPELAVFSFKRLQSGSLSVQELNRILLTYRPEQVLLGRYPQVLQTLEPYLNLHYVQRYLKRDEKDKIVQYVLKSVNAHPP